MYEAYWGLTSSPFRAGGEEAFYYPAEAHQGALMKLRYALESRQEAALLVGPAGTGKTMLIGELRRRMPQHLAPWVHVVFPEMSNRELIAYIADEIGAPRSDSHSTTLDRGVRRIQEFLAESADRGRTPVLVVDEAHLLDDVRGLETLRLLTNFQAQGRPSFTLLLVAQPPILSTLARMPSLEQRLAVKALLQPFSQEETACYVNHRLQAAGRDTTIYESAALEALHQQTGGIARQINRLCDLTLLVGYAEQQETITADCVASVSEELVAVPTE
jgi:general secretion pathway protein A